jgi:quercetin dioxygenase-like cupin family protein
VAGPVRLRSEETGGQGSLIEIQVDADFAGPPLHVHDFDEAFHVLEGELTFQVEQDLITKLSGEFAFVPRGVPHTLANRSGEPARYLLICTPAGFERSFARRAAEQDGLEPRPWAPFNRVDVIRLRPRIDERPDEPKGAEEARAASGSGGRNEPRKHRPQRYRC